MNKIREPVTHNLKIWPEHYSAVCAGVKRAELRKNDRDYRAGDTLDLCEWDKDDESFTGEFISVTVTHVADVGEWMPGYVLLSIERAPRDRAEPVAYMIGGHYLMHANDPKVDNYSSAVPLYTAPPATVVADDRESFEKFYGSGTTPGIDRVPPWFQEMIKGAFWEVWKGSRAALQQQPVSQPYKLSEWTNEQCLEFLAVAFRHAEIKGDFELDDLRLGVKMANAMTSSKEG